MIDKKCKSMQIDAGYFPWLWKWFKLPLIWEAHTELYWLLLPVITNGLRRDYRKTFQDIFKVKQHCLTLLIKAPWNNPPISLMGILLRRIKGSRKLHFVDPWGGITAIQGEPLHQGTNFSGLTKCLFLSHHTHLSLFLWEKNVGSIVSFKVVDTIWLRYPSHVAAVKNPFLSLYHFAFFTDGLTPHTSKLEMCHWHVNEGKVFQTTLRSSRCNVCIHQCQPQTRPQKHLQFSKRTTCFAQVIAPLNRPKKVGLAKTKHEEICQSKQPRQDP